LAAVAVLTTFFTCFRRFLFIVGKIASGSVAAFFASLGCFFTIVGEVARVRVTFGSHDNTSGLMNYLARHRASINWDWIMWEKLKLNFILAMNGILLFAGG